MKIGFQTIVWWPFEEKLEYMLDVIAAAGYQGVELTQRPDQLGSIEQLLKLLEKYKLELIGLSGGPLEKRMDFCGDFQPEYLYVENWNEQIAELAKKRRFTLAIHPHVFKPTHRFEAAREHLKKDSKLKFLPDTAHLFIAGDDPVEAIKLCQNQIAAVHFKDWTAEFGRLVHRYAKGFIELGGGDIDLDGVLGTLRDIGYKGWLVVEQDYTRTDPAISTFKCAKWLASRGLLETAPAKSPKKPLARDPERPITEAEARFLEMVVSAGWQDIQSCYGSIARAFFELCESELVTLWTCSPAYELMDLVAVECNRSVPLKNVLDWRNTLSGDTIEQHGIQWFNLSDPGIAQRFGCPELLEAIDSKAMVSIPVFNPWNPNHVRLVVNIFHKEKLHVSDAEFFRLAVAVGYSTSSALDEICSTSAAKVNMLVGKNRQVKDFAKGLAELVGKVMDCEEVGVLLKSMTGNKLEQIGGKGEEWIGAETVEAFTEQFQDTRETLIIPRKSLVAPKDKEEFQLEQRATCILTPFLRTDGKRLGYIYCGNKRTPRKFGTPGIFAFSDDDAAILEAIAQAAVPHLEVLTFQERRKKALGRMTHELKVPLVAIRGATDFMVRTPGVNEFFDYDYPGDIWSWSILMGRLIDNADVFRYSTEKIPIEVSRTRLLPGVIAPAIKQVRFLLEERGFSKNRIEYKNIDKFPELWLDRNRFQQVMFNLLSNAIKYAYNDSDAFEVQIEGDERGAEFVIWFRDWGMGIESGMEDAIFEEGIRGKNAVEVNVTGQGLGLWIVRQIIERHGGTIKVTNLKLPTELEISLPYRLTSQRP